MDILTIIVLAVILLSAFIGMKVGLIKTLFSMFSMIIALILAIWISPFVSNILKTNEKVVTYFSDKVNYVLHLDEIGGKVTDQMRFIDDLPIPESFKSLLIENNNNELYIALGVDKFIDYISYSIAHVIINAISFFGTFVICIILLYSLCFILNIVSKLPILNELNKIGGLIAGVLHGLIIIWVLCILLTAFGGTTWGQEAFLSISESTILSFVYNNNLIIKYITDLKKLL